MRPMRIAFIALFTLFPALATTTMSIADSKKSVLWSDIPAKVEIVGKLNAPLGSYVRISGERAQGLMLEEDTLVVSKINDQAFPSDKPLLVLLSGIARIPPNVNIDVEGYETGEFVGGPPPDLVRRFPGVQLTQQPWHFRTKFVVLRVNSPASLLRESPAPGRSNLTTNSDQQEIKISTQELERILQSFPSAITQARAVPYFKDGRQTGLRLFAIRSDGVFARIGLQNGDIVLATDGVAVSDLGAIVTIFSTLRDKKSVVLSVERLLRTVDLKIRCE